MSKRIFSLLLTMIMLATCMVMTVSSSATPTLYIIGDGVVAEVGQDMYPAQGWGAYIKDVTKDINVVNLARRNETMNSFIENGTWKEVSAKLAPGDFVMVAFGADSYDSRGKSYYSKSLLKYGTDIKKHGAEAIFVTPAAVGGTLAVNTLLDPMTDAVKKSAVTLGATVCDLNGAMRKLFLDANGKESDMVVNSVYNTLFITYNTNSQKEQSGVISDFAKNAVSAKDYAQLSIQGAIYASNTVAAELCNSDSKISKYMKNTRDAKERPAQYDVLTEMDNDTTKGILFNGMEYQGRPTQVFAYLGIPEDATAENPVPAIVLVHGGSGKADLSAVEHWVSKGYAAISYYCVESSPSTDNTFPSGDAINYTTGPRKTTGIGDAENKNINDEDQWAYHVISAASLSYNLLNSLPQVKRDQIGILGLSWGGIVTAMTIGRDTRFKAAATVYGAGYLDENQAQLKTISKWDGRHTFENAKKAGMKTFWVNGTNDTYFDVASTTKSKDATDGYSLIITRLAHDPTTGFGINNSVRELVPFFDSVLKGGPSLPNLKKPKISGSTVTIPYESEAPIRSARLLYSPSGVLCENGVNNTVWGYAEAKINKGSITATLPAGAVGFFVEVTDANRCRVTTGYIEK